MLVVAAAGALLSGCIDSPTAVQPTCEPVSLTVAEERGDTVVTTTGLRYVPITVGEGAAVETCRALAVHYRGFLEDGTEFDSSEGRPALEFIPGLPMPGFGRVISGFEEGVIGMRVEGERWLIIPPDLAYGNQAVTDAQGNVVVPPNSTVIFQVRVVAVQVQ
jgi:FKBP-type peptidyl-prolyl cis-trans isomerase